MTSSDKRVFLNVLRNNSSKKTIYKTTDYFLNTGTGACLF